MTRTIPGWQRWSPLPWLIVLSLQPGCESAFERGALDGLPCPCAAGWVCDEQAGGGGVCVRTGQVENATSSGGTASAGGSGNGGSSSSGAGGSTTACAPAIEPSDAPCPPECDSCSAGTCQIRCDVALGCSGSSQSPLTLGCPAGFHCEVACSAAGSCNELRVQCTGGGACSVLCTGKETCRSLHVSCAEGPCLLACGNAPQACKTSELACGTGACDATCDGKELPVVNNCNASCSTQCGCQ